MKPAARSSRLAVGLTLGLLATAPASARLDLYSFLPNAFTPNPTLAMTVYTEYTPYGREFFPPTSDQPVYFEAHNSGQKRMGHVMAGEISPPPETMHQVLLQALATNGLQPVPAGQRARLALVYYWGSHLADRDIAGIFPELASSHLLERATLIGGRAYRNQLLSDMDLGYIAPPRSAKQTFLYEQARESVNFVVVSAYDYETLLLGEHRLVWRTTMTVSTNGVSMEDSLPPLILTAAESLGRPMDSPTALTRPVRRGTVTLGPLKIIASNPDPDETP